MCICYYKGVEDELSCTEITLVAASFIGHDYESCVVACPEVTFVVTHVVNTSD